jgi:hypothetical protein
MSGRRVPAPHHVFDETTDLDSFSVSTASGASDITAQVVYVEDVTPIPREGQIVEFHVLGTSVQGIVTHSSLMNVRDEILVLIMAMRLQE